MVAKIIAVSPPLVFIALHSFEFPCGEFVFNKEKGPMGVVKECHGY